MSVILPTARSKPSNELAAKSILIYGPPKIGKSTFASKFPDALFLECEPGLGSLEVFKVPTYTWKDLMSAYDLIAGGKHSFKTIVIDTVDNAFKYCTDYVNSENSVKYEGDMPHGKGWAFVKNEWHRMLTKFASLPYGLILLSHATEREIETRTGTAKKTVPSLPDRARGVVLGMVDMILYCDTISVTDKAGVVSVQRIVRTKPHPSYEAGDRTGKLPDTIPLDFDALCRALATDQKKEISK